MTTLPPKQLSENFLNTIKKEVSPQTLDNYNFYLRRFWTWAKITIIDEIDKPLVENYRHWLAQQTTKDKTLQDSTINYHLIALRSFLTYLQNQKISCLGPEQIKLAKLPNRKVQVLDNLEIASLMAMPLKTKEEKIIQLRDQALLELLFCSGLRVSELANLKINEIDLAKDNFTMRNKFGKPRTIFLSNQGRQSLGQYLNKRLDGSEYLFIRHDRAANEKNQTNLTPRSIQRLVQKYVKAAGIKNKVTPRIIRHTIASRLIAEGTDLKSVQTILGHASPLTTKKYE